jgi:hypothetical protein
VSQYFREISILPSLLPSPDAGSADGSTPYIVSSGTRSRILSFVFKLILPFVQRTENFATDDPFKWACVCGLVFYVMKETSYLFE